MSTEPIKAKRGRKSKKELMAACLLACLRLVACFKH